MGTLTSGDPAAVAPAQAGAIPVADLIFQLSSPNAVVRERARAKLVVLGHSVVDQLTVVLETANEHGRSEACKALAEIADTTAIPALIRALESEQHDVRWTASEALVNIGADSVEPLLKSLIDRAFAHTILFGAYHVLRTFAERTPEPIFEPLLAAIKSPEPGVSVPPAAERVLEKWRELEAEFAGGRRWYLMRKPHVAKRLPTPLL